MPDSSMAYIVGTSHLIQTGTESKYRLAGEQFELYLKKLQHTFDIKAIAEEMNTEALREYECTTSIPMAVAASSRIPHRFCDPDKLERIKLGIRQENDIRAIGFISGWSEKEISSRILESHAIRENYWFHQLLGLNKWPVMFICGADHVGPFSALLKQKGITTKVVVHDWSVEGHIA